MNAWLTEAWQFLWHPLMAPLSVTALAGALAYVSARRAVFVARFASFVACVAALVFCVRLFLGPPVELDVTWLEIDGLRVAVAMASSTFGALIAVGVAFFGLAIGVYALASERGDRDEGRFFACLCWTVTGGVGAALADDLIWLLICWEIVSLCLYLLLNLRTDDAPAGAAKTYGLIGFGDAAMLLAIALLGVTQGTFRISDLSIAVNSPLMYVCYLLFVAAALAKAGAIPLHSWIPAAASSASVATFALLPASIDKLLGIYLLATFSLRVFVLDDAMRIVLMTIGAVTILAAVLMAMVQHRLKKLLSFHAVSQVGYMVLGIGTGLPIGIAGGVLHMVNHAIYKSCLFLTAGAVERAGGTDDLNRLGGLAARLPVTFICCLIAALAISGVPPLNGFVSKWLVYQACLSEQSVLGVLCLVAAVFGSALTLASFFKVLTTVFWGPTPATLAAPESVWARFARGLPMTVLAVLCIVFGVAAQWPLQRLILPSLAGMGVTPELDVGAAELSTGALGLWAPLPATILIVLGMLGGLVLYLLGRVRQPRVVDTFVGGERPADLPMVKVAATGFYQTIQAQPVLGGALRDGEQSVFDVYRLGGQYGGSLVRVLREVHTGVLSLYVSWCVVGVVIIVAYLMAIL